jgi:hypothetical protein
VPLEYLSDEIVRQPAAASMGELDLFVFHIHALDRNLTAETLRSQRNLFLFGGERPPNKKASARAKIFVTKGRKFSGESASHRFSRKTFSSAPSVSPR